MRILLIEDDGFDAFVTDQYLKKGGVDYTLDIAHNGAEAIDFLMRSGSKKEATLPDLILVDIGLPDMDGREIICRLNQDSRFGRVPTVVLTGQSPDENPVEKLNLYNHAYVNKWVNMIDFLSLIKAVADVRLSTGRQH